MDVMLSTKELADFIRSLGLIGPDFSGQLVINLNQGGVTEIEKVEIVLAAPEGGA